MPKVAVIIPAGGMRNAWVTGFILGAEIKPCDISVIIAASSGAPTAAYFITNNCRKSIDIWVNRLTDPRVFNWDNLYFFRRPADVDFLIDECCADLDFEALRQASTKLVVPLFRVADARTVYSELNGEDPRLIFKATSALPGLAKNVYLKDGRRYADGGTHIVLPVGKAVRMGYKKILVLDNRPHADKMQPISGRQARFAFPFSRICRRALLNRTALFNFTRDFIREPHHNLDCKYIAPNQQIETEGFTRSKNIIKDAIDLGFENGVRKKEEIAAFLRHT